MRLHLLEDVRRHVAQQCGAVGVVHEHDACRCERDACAPAAPSAPAGAPASGQLCDAALRTSLRPVAHQCDALGVVHQHEVCRHDPHADAPA
eukprot:1161263-Pelagomonas_calceolata.AAC.15